MLAFTLPFPERVNKLVLLDKGISHSGEYQNQNLVRLRMLFQR